MCNDSDSESRLIIDAFSEAYSGPEEETIVEEERDREGGRVRVLGGGGAKGPCNRRLVQLVNAQASTRCKL